jgi:hypothetical protein
MAVAAYFGAWRYLPTWNWFEVCLYHTISRQDAEFMGRRVVTQEITALPMAFQNSGRIDLSQKSVRSFLVFND